MIIKFKKFIEFKKFYGRLYSDHHEKYYVLLYTDHHEIIRSFFLHYLVHFL